MINTSQNIFLNYYNEDVIDRFVNIYNVDENEAASIFEETKKWLWLGATSKFSFIIDDSLIIIDEMWHNFILFTEDYEKFCLDKFGRYIHHKPTTKKQKLDWVINEKVNLKNYKRDLKKQYELIYDNLGEETLTKWYVYFAETYTKDYIKTITK